MGHITASNFFCGFGRCSIAMEAIDYASLLEKNKKSAEEGEEIGTERQREAWLMLMAYLYKLIIN